MILETWICPTRGGGGTGVAAAPWVGGSYAGEGGGAGRAAPLPPQPLPAEASTLAWRRVLRRQRPPAGGSRSAEAALPLETECEAHK